MELLQWIFFGPARLIAAWPYAGVLLAACLILPQLWLHWRQQSQWDRQLFRRPGVFAGILWLIFNGYELQMAAIASKVDGGLLRIDLMVLVPILYVLTAFAVVSMARPTQPPPASSAEERKD